jgi:beta-galactosidase/beta-glucuronidase
VTCSNHPAPQLQRAHWRDLNGAWKFAFDTTATWHHPADVIFDREIIVPFAPESRASGLDDQGFHGVVWYSLTLTLEERERPENGARLLLHFGAVDYCAKVWVNRQLVAEHRGGHSSFYADVTAALAGGNTLEIVVRAEDDPHDLAKPRGKQDWLAQAHSIWYPRTTGIWQTVWLELVPVLRLERLVWTTNVERWEITLEAQLHGVLRPGVALRLRLYSDTHANDLVNDTYQLSSLSVSRTIALPDPGIDNAREAFLWSPEHPQIIEAEVQLIDQAGVIIDSVQSYTALRSVDVRDRQFFLNGRPYFLRMVLDQGYWDEGLMTANDEQLRQDVELTKRLGFNGARKHQKIENPRWLYWADVLGLLVWQEMPSTYSFNSLSVERLVTEWTETIKRDRSHPCIVAWVPLNESWGVPDLPKNPAQRDLLRALYFLTKTLDPTRPVIGNDGWECLLSDIIGIHDYDHDPDRLEARYQSQAALDNSLDHFRPGGRALTLAGFTHDEQPVILSEFGGIAYSPHNAGWGYSRASDASTLLAQYVALLAAVHRCRPTLSGFCYTQLTDTFQEENGLLFMNRTPKANIEALAAATRDPDNPHAQDADSNPLGYSKRWLERQQVQQENV